jgi:hypothetical protein
MGSMRGAEGSYISYRKNERKSKRNSPGLDGQDLGR